jgi:hypothetical protein
MNQVYLDTARLLTQVAPFVFTGGTRRWLGPGEDGHYAAERAGPATVPIHQALHPCRGTKPTRLVSLGQQSLGRSARITERDQCSGPAGGMRPTAGFTPGLRRIDVRGVVPCLPVNNLDR